MSNFEYEDDEDDITTNTGDSGNDLVKQLRKAAKQKDKELQELRSQFESLNKAQRERAIKDTLESRGVNSKIAKFIPSDIDPTEESLSKWLEENGDLFGFTKQEEAPVDDSNLAELRKQNAVTQGALTPDRAEDLAMRIDQAQSQEELNRILASN